MKYSLIFVLVLSMLFSIGCFVTPEPEPEPEPICVPGYYQIWYSEWSLNPGCEDEVWFDAGTYWQGEDELFYVGEPVPVEDVFDIYGKCPVEVSE